MPNIVAVVAPALLIGVFVEWFLAWRRGRLLHGFDAVFSDVGCGAGQLLTGIFVRSAVLVAYTWAWERFRLLDLATDAWWVFLLAIFASDLSYYGWHRFSHRVPLWWAVHVVHHQSEEYNLAVSLRQSWFSRFSAVPFYAWLALLGIPPLALAIADGLNNLYQYFIHTQLVRRLGPLEWVFNTPAHHRVHHAINERYIDHNFGGIFIVWDRLFGTFEPERDGEPCVFGTLEGFPSFNPVWAQFHPMVRLARAAWSARDPSVLVRPQVGADMPDPFVKHEVERPSVVTAYVAAWAALGSGFALWVMVWGEGSPLQALPWVVLLVITLGSLGALLDREPWARTLELTRLTAVLVTGYVFGGPAGFVLLAAAVASGGWWWVYADKASGVAAG